METEIVITVAETIKMLRISKPTLYRYLKNDPSFPKPIHLTEKKVVFKVEALKNWLVKKETMPCI
ncbi:MAG: helix-turn-helix transcriptional regulator [Succinivibrio sp.]